MRGLGWVVLLTFLVSSTGFAAPAQADLESRRKALNDLLAERWEYTLRTSPIFASILGDKRWNDKLDDFSQKAIDDDLEQSKKYLARFEAIDTTGFPEQEVLNKTLMVRDLRMTLEGARFKTWEMPVIAVRRSAHLSSATGRPGLVEEREGLRRLYFAAEGDAPLLG